MTKIKNLYTDSNGNFFTRVVIPKDVVELLGQREFKKAHGTKERVEAIYHHEVAEAQFRRQIEVARIELKSEAQITNALIVSITNHWKERKAAQIHQGGVFVDHYVQKQGSLYTTLDEPVVLLLEFIEQFKDGKPERLESYYVKLNKVLGAELKRALEMNELPLRELSKYHKMLLVEFAKAYIQLCRLALSTKTTELTALNIGVTPVSIPSEVTPEHLPDSQSQTFEEVAKECAITSKRRGDVTSVQTEQAYKTSISRFTEVFPNKLINSFSRADINQFRKLLEGVPSNAKKDVKCQPLVKQVELAEAQSLKTLSQASVRRELMAISKVFTFAVDSGYIESSPATRSSVGIRRSEAVAEEDKTYTHEEAVKIFTSKLFADTDAVRQTKYGLSAYWIPLMLYYTGARAEEIAQLYVGDIRFKSDGISTLMITNEREDQSTKDGKRREVPIHSHLLELGLAEYVASLPISSRLFPNLTADTYGKYNTKVGQWLAKYIRNDVGIKRRGLKPLHGFRHGFKTACRIADVREDVEDSITGHSAKSVGRKYGAYTVEMKAELIEKIPRCM